MFNMEYIKTIINTSYRVFKVKSTSILFYFQEHHLEHKFLSARQKCLPMENLHAVAREA
jgi:hypothetical protein